MSESDFTRMASGKIDWPEKKKRRRTTPKANLEDGVKKECMALLAGLQKTGQVRLYERRNVLFMRTEDGGVIQAGVKGRADIWAVVLDGRPADCPAIPTHVEIECKRRDGKGVQSDAQKDFEALCHRRGIPYLLVTSAADLRRELRAIGVEVPDA